MGGMMGEILCRRHSRVDVSFENDDNFRGHSAWRKNPRTVWAARNPDRSERAWQYLLQSRPASYSRRLEPGAPVSYSADNIEFRFQQHLAQVYH
jgi:hypothetical protein